MAQQNDDEWVLLVLLPDPHPGCQRQTLQKKRVIPAQAYRRFGPKRLYETHTSVFVQNAYLKTPLRLARSSRHISRIFISAFWGIGNVGMVFKYKKSGWLVFFWCFFKQPHLGVL